jgi:c-di-GMP-related signal transduction protein
MSSDDIGDGKMEVFVSRQPVFDREKKVYAYELAFRSGFQAYYEALKGDKASADMMAFVNFAELTDGKRGLVDFPRDLLLMEFPILFDRNSLIAGVPSSLAEDDQVAAKCHALKKVYGFSVAVSDLTPDTLASPLLDSTDLARVDFAATPPDVRQTLCKDLASRDIRPIARNVKSEADFQQAMSEGFAFAEGDFFSKPDVQPDKPIASNKLICMQLLQKVNQPELSYDETAGIVQQDVSLTYRLLKMMNSAWFGLRCEITSVKHALVLLGPAEIRRWASMVAVRSSADDKPKELLLCSLTRAKFAESVGGLAGMTKEAPELFLMGMFSVLDALMDRPMEELLDELPLSQGIRDALTGQTCDYRTVYDAILAYERGQWGLFSDFALALNIKEDSVPEMFRASLSWAIQGLKEA